MYKKLTSVLILIFTISISCWSQVLLTGTVISQSDSLTIPGVIVTEKGTNNSTTTNYDGYYSIEVGDTSTLVFSFVGMVTRELPVYGKNVVNTTLKEALIYEAWDQKIGIYLNSGILNNPVGGQFDFSAPLFINGMSMISSIGYQTNLLENQLFSGNIGLNGFRFDTYYWLDLGMYYKRTLFNDKINVTTYSIESTHNTLLPISFILGYGHLKLEELGSGEQDSKSGLTLGSNIRIPYPVLLSLTGRVTIYKGARESQVKLQRNFGRFATFVRYYNVESFTEVSIGVGIELTYLLKYQRNADTYE